jgi:hypothetical protein
MASNELKNLLNPNAGGDLGDIVNRARKMGDLTRALIYGRHHRRKPPRKRRSRRHRLIFRMGKPTAF